MAPVAHEQQSSKDRAAQAQVLLALMRACRDDLRPAIRREGIDERDLAFEASLLRQPSDVETTTYATRMRNSVLRVLRAMQREGLISMELGPSGAYRILPTPQGEKLAALLMRPWHRKLWDRLRGRVSRRM